MKNIFVMSASDFKYCRICLRSGIQENLSDGGTFRNVFYRVFGVKVMSKQFWLCMWCKSTLRKTHQLIRVAEESQKILEHCGQKSSELEINKHTFGPYKLSCTHNNHEDIPPLENEESYIFGEENMPEETYENNDLTEEIKTEIDEIHIENVEQVNCEAETVKEASLDPKRRKNIVNYKDFKFVIKHLSFDEQIKEIEMKKNTEKYKSMKYQCESCGVGFLTEDVFKQHMVKHEKITDHKCPTCHIYLKTKDVLSQHILAHRRRFICQNCGATYNRWRHCVLHRYKCDNIQNNVVCDECKKIFSNSISLDVHIKGVHKKERKYMCEKCDRRFATKQRLTVHIRAHSNTRPFPCQLCPKSFTTQSNLRAHAAAHTAHKRHYCVECNLYYKSEKGLRRHFRESKRHNEEFGFVCPTCSKKFLTENVLNSHIKTRHLTTYSCEFCDKTFSSNTNLRKHMRCLHATSTNRDMNAGVAN